MWETSKPKRPRKTLFPFSHYISTPYLLCIQQKSFISSFMNAYMAEKRRLKTFPSFFLVSYLLMQMLWWWWWSGWHFMKIECPLILFVDCLPSFPTYFNAVEYIYLEMASQGKKYSKYFYITNMHTSRKNWRWMYNANVLCACRHSVSISVFSSFLLCIHKKYYLEDAAAIPTMLLTVCRDLHFFSDFWLHQLFSTNSFFYYSNREYNAYIFFSAHCQ